jgi:hypothetical protein
MLFQSFVVVFAPARDIFEFTVQRASLTTFTAGLLQRHLGRANISRNKYPKVTSATAPNTSPSNHIPGYSTSAVNAREVSHQTYVADGKAQLIAERI